MVLNNQTNPGTSPVEEGSGKFIQPVSQLIRDTTLMQLIWINLLETATKNGGKGMLLKPGARRNPPVVDLPWYLPMSVESSAGTLLIL